LRNIHHFSDADLVKQNVCSWNKIGAHPIFLKESIMTEKEWMEDVKERLEKEESFTKNKILFSTGKRVPYSFEILNYKDDGIRQGDVSFVLPK
jgi:hypothetical protein